MVATAQVATFTEYLDLVAALQADQERSGRTVRRVQMTVAEMRAALAVHDWPNDPQHRAAVIGLAD